MKWTWDGGERGLAYTTSKGDTLGLLVLCLESGTWELICDPFGDNERHLGAVTGAGAAPLRWASTLMTRAHRGEVDR